MATTLSSPIYFPLEVVQGSTFEYSWIFKDSVGAAWSFIGHKAKLEVRKKPGSTGTPLLSASSDAGSITFPGSGELKVVIPHAAIEALTFTGDSIEYYYDLEIENVMVTPSRIIKPFIPSTFTVYREVTI
jgi:hypothetical protein